MNHYWRTPNRGPLAGRTMISSEGRDYRKRVGLELLAQGASTLRLSGSVRVAILANPPDRRQRDLDNLLKPLLDALAHGGMIENDRFVDDLRIVRGPVAAGGFVTVAVDLIGSAAGRPVALAGEEAPPLT